MSLIGPLINIDDVIGLSYAEWNTAQETARQKAIVLARQYHDGEIAIPLTDRLKEFLGEDVDFRMNVCRNVVSAVAERLHVIGFDAPDPKMIEWAQKVWSDNNLDALQDDVHEGALRDGEFFIMVDWDFEEGRPIIVPHERFTDTQNGGDGYGCYMKYVQDDPNQKAEFGIKIWTEMGPSKVLVMRLNKYYRDRVEKYQKEVGGLWERIEAEGGDPDSTEEVADWSQVKRIPLIHFQNKDLRCEAWDAFPLQNAINKSLIDLMSSEDLTAFRIFYSLGFIPTTDGKAPKEDRSNWLKLEPGQVVGTTKPANVTEFGAIEPADLSQLMDVTHQLVLWLAMVTNTPVSRFISTKLIASADTLKEQEEPLKSRVKSRQTRFGNSWKECFKVCMALENAFGENRYDPKEAQLEVIWGEGSPTGESERLDNSKKKQDLGIPQEQLWKELGYDQKTIKAMQKLQAEAQKQKQNEEENRDGQDERDGGSPGGNRRDDGQPGTNQGTGDGRS